MNKTLYSAYFNQFKGSCMNLLSYPIKVALYERKLTKKDLINLLAKHGYVYDYYLLVVNLDGKANNFSLHYFTHIYKVLNLPQPSYSYINESALRWFEIKAFKLEQRNINRIKRGQLPIK